MTCKMWWNDSFDWIGISFSIGKVDSGRSFVLEIWPVTIGIWIPCSIIDWN